MFAASGGAADTSKTYIEDVFSSTMYSGTSENQDIVNGLALGTTAASVTVNYPTTFLNGRTYKIIYAAGKYVLLAQNGIWCTVRTSTDGVTWNGPYSIDVGTDYSAGSPSAAIFDIVYTGTKFIVAGYVMHYSSGSMAYATSTDGVTWTSLQKTSANYKTNFQDASMAVNASGMVVLFMGQEYRITSDHGTTWSASATVAPYISKVTVNSSGRFVAVGSNGGDWSNAIAQYATSTNGTSWTTGNMSGTIPYSMYAVTVNSSGLFVAVGGVANHPANFAGSRSIVATSTNGTSWSVQELLGARQPLMTVAANSAGMFLAAGSSNYATSIDGYTWTAVRSTSMLAYGSVAKSNGDFFISGVLSSDGTTGALSSTTPTSASAPGYGGMVILRQYESSTSNAVVDSVRGPKPAIFTNGQGAQTDDAEYISEFRSNGFLMPKTSGFNASGYNYISWAFRRASKFFDIVSYTGNGINRTIDHNLESVPGLILIKRTDSGGGNWTNWSVWHRSFGNNEYMQLNYGQYAKYTNQTTMWNSTAPTSTNFSLGTSAEANAAGGSFIAYLFGHDSTTDGLIQCGSYTGNGSSTGPVVNLGWEPQFLLVKTTGDTGSANTGNWTVIDNMRGMYVDGADKIATFNVSAADSSGDVVIPTSTGFQVSSTSQEVNTSGVTYIYMAIRRGPMRNPTNGTSVFAMDTYRNSSPAFAASFAPDLAIQKSKSTSEWTIQQRLTNASYLCTNTTAAAATFAENYSGPTWYRNGFRTSGGTAVPSVCGWMFRRAPGFFDVVCYTGNGVARTINHNLRVAPELMIVKSRSRSDSYSNWCVYHKAAGGSKSLYLNSNAAVADTGDWNYTDPTAASFPVFGISTNSADNTYVAYLFASCPGVSKVGSYTGNGSSQTINCGFTNGARFFLVKATSTTGNWWVYDTARGVVAAADPTLALNTTAAETSADAVDPDSTGIIVNQEATCSINANGVSYIYLAIA